MPKSESSRETVAQGLMFVSGYVQRLLRYEAKQLGLRWTALMVLKDLQLLGPVSQRTLAEIEQVTAPTMTVLIGQMAAKKWIRREAAKGDARVSLVRITGAGRRELKRAGRLLQARLQAELGSLPDETFEQLSGPLGSFSAAVLKKIHGLKLD